MTEECKLKADDKVKRIDRPGCLGIVQSVREEVIGSTGDGDKSLLVEVKWDNGTVSFFDPESLEVV